jgi:hypothetical protein
LIACSTSPIFTFLASLPVQPAFFKQLFDEPVLPEKALGRILEWLPSRPRGEGGGGAPNGARPKERELLRETKIHETLAFVSGGLLLIFPGIQTDGLGILFLGLGLLSQLIGIRRIPAKD